MTKAERTANMIGVVVPFLGLIAAVVLLWNKWVDWIDIGIMVFTYLLYGLGVTVGYHRLLTHRAFKTYKPVEYGWAIVGSMGLQGGVLDWVADHRKHHAHTDQEGDPHSPHVGHGEGIRGLWHAHTGWLFETHGQADWKKYARELYEDRGMRRINKLFPLWALYSLLVPALLGFVLHGFTLEGALQRPRLGRPRPRVLPPPHHVVDQLRLPLLRQPPVRDRRPLHQRLLARPAVARRGLAPQPPRVPALRAARPALVGDRRLGAGHLRDGEGRARVERRPHLARAPGGQGGRAQGAGRGLSYQAAERVSRRGGSSRTIGAANGRTIMRAGLRRRRRRGAPRALWLEAGRLNGGRAHRGSPLWGVTAGGDPAFPSSYEHPRASARALHEGDPATRPATLRHPAQSDAAMTSRASGAAVAPPWPAPTSMTATAISGSAAS